MGKPKNSTKSYDKDTEVFIAMSQELKNEGNKLFQKREYEAAMSKYDKALKLLPRVHIDVSYIRTNMAACYMKMGGLPEYPHAIHQCNLALEVTPKYSKALLKRAECYQGVNRPDSAMRDVMVVLNMEPSNSVALEIAERLKSTIGDQGLIDAEIEPQSPESVKFDLQEKQCSVSDMEDHKEMRDVTVGLNMDRSNFMAPEIAERVNFDLQEKQCSVSDMQKIVEDDKVVVVEEKIIMNIDESVSTKSVKLVFGEDIRLARVPINCRLDDVIEAVRDRFSCSGAVLVKYRDEEGDLVTITNEEELRWAEAASESQNALKLYIFENGDVAKMDYENGDVAKHEEDSTLCVDDWVVDFARLFKSYVGLDSDGYLDLHELGTRVYSEAMEETVTTEDAQTLFQVAADKFQEMAALALFNWGNVHMSKARKGIHMPDNECLESSEDVVAEKVKSGYEYVMGEYTKARRRYEEALRVKSDFYEGYLALGQAQFEEAKLSWYYYSVSRNSESFNSTELLQLYNAAEDNVEKGVELWEESERIRKRNPTKIHPVRNLGLDEFVDDVSSDKAAIMRSQINLMWGTMLYERSIIEFKLGLPVWHECLAIAVEKFELAGASPTDIAVMVKNHCSNESAVEGLEFKIDEIVQAWNEMYEAKRWQSRVSSFRLEPLFRRRIPRLYHALRH